MRHRILPGSRCRSAGSDRRRPVPPGTRRRPSPTPRSSSTPIVCRWRSHRPRRTSGARPARTWTPGTSGSPTRTRRRWPTSGSKPACPRRSSSPRWSTTRTATRGWPRCSPRSSRRSRAASASCGNARRAHPTGRGSGGRPWSGRPGAPTSGRRSSPRPASTCTGNWSGPRWPRRAPLPPPGGWCSAATP